MTRMKKPRWDRIRNMDWLALLGYLVSIPLDLLFNLPSIHGMGPSNDDCSHIPILNSTYNPFTFFRPGTNLESDVWNGVTLTSGIGASFSYIGRVIDWFTKGKTLINRKQYPERMFKPEEIKNEHYRNVGTTVGITIGLLLGVGISALFLIYGGWALIIVLTAVIATLNMVRACGGLGSRIMQLVDRYYDKDKPRQGLFRNFDLSIILSLFAAIIPIALLAVDGGLTSSIFDIIAFTATTVVLVASINSGAHFIGRALDWLCRDVPLIYLILLPILRPLAKLFSFELPIKMDDQKSWGESWREHFWKNCTNENIANLVGIILGLALGIMIALTLPVPGFLAAIPITFILLKPLVVLLMMDRFVSISIRVGRMLDRLFSTDENKFAPTLLNWLLDVPPGGYPQDKPDDNCKPALQTKPDLEPPAKQALKTLANEKNIELHPISSAGHEEQPVETYKNNLAPSWQTKTFSTPKCAFWQPAVVEDEADNTVVPEAWQGPTLTMGNSTATAA